MKSAPGRSRSWTPSRSTWDRTSLPSAADAATVRVERARHAAERQHDIGEAARHRHESFNARAGHDRAARARSYDGPTTARPHVADVVGMRVREEDDVHVAKPPVGLVGRAAGIVENACAGWILEQERAIVSTELAAWLPSGVIRTSPV